MLSSFFLRLRKLLGTRDFDPSPLGLIINHIYHSRRAIIGFVRHAAPSVSGIVLDVGCGSKPYRNLIECDGYFGIDIENPGHSHEDEQIDIYYDGSALPLADNSVDSVVCFEVMEHVQNLPPFMAEIQRVLKPGGHFVATAPFMWEEHEQPNDYRRFTSFGLAHTVQENGFDVVEQHKLAPGWPAAISQINCLIALLWRDQTNVPLKALMWLIGRLPITVMNVAGLLLSYLPAGQDMYLDNAIIARKR